MLQIANAMSATTDQSRDGNATVQKQLELAWLDLDRALSLANDGPGDAPQEPGALLLPSELLVVDESPTPPPPPISRQLVHQRHDSSMLFSTTTFREIAMTAMRGFATAQAAALVTASQLAPGPKSATFVPIALPTTAMSPRDKWLWRWLTVATTALLFFFVAALDLLLVGGR
ncbi:MAG: hypothetical protein JWM53_3400 [bacterium]|nr:hypothetical protein [bacterium]